jgi:hypothetical protein
VSKGSGRRRITPSDGLRYDPNTDMTNIEERGAGSFQSGGKEIRLGLRTGASPTGDNRGRRYAGKGRKDDNRNWKRHTKGKQYEHNQLSREAQEHHRPVPESVASHLREMSITADIIRGYPCKAWSGFRGIMPLKTIAPAAEKFLVKFGGTAFKGVAERMARPYQYSYSHRSTYKAPPSPSLWKNPNPPLMKIGFAILEQKVQRLLDRIRWNSIDEFGKSRY